MYRLVVSIILFFLAKEIFSQDTLNSNAVETTSYRLYVDKNWKQLISFGEKALDKGFDYYYLRLRVGVAHYELKNYREAQMHFWKAYRFNSTDDILMEYLYYCYIFNGQYDEARNFSKKLSPSLAKKLKTDKAPFLDYLLLEGGIKTTSQVGLADAYYGQFGLGHHIGKNVSFFHAATLFGQKSQKSNLDQKQYYVSANVPIKKSWLISPAFHLLNRTITYNPPPKQQMPPPWMPQPPKQPLPPPPSTVNYFVSSLSIKKSVSKFDIEICTTISNIDSLRQAQGNISLSYFPFGNNKLFFSGIAYVQKESIANDFKYAFSSSLTAVPFSKVILSASYLYNQAYHISEMNGYIANNSSDLTTSRIAFMSNFILSSHVNFYLLYQLENKSQNNSTNNISTNYSYNNFIGGLKFIL